MQIWATCATPCAATAGTHRQRAQAALLCASADSRSHLSLPCGHGSGWGKTVSLGGLTSCRTEKWKFKQDPLKACGKPVSLWTGLCPGCTGRFLLWFPCITPARSQTQWKYPFYKAQHFFFRLSLAVLPDSASPSAAKEARGSSQPQVEPGRLTQLHPSAQPWVRNRDQDQAGKPPASLAPAAPSSETSEQNVPGWELGTSLLLVAYLQKSFHTPQTVPPASTPSHRRPMKESASTKVLGSR